MHIQLYTGAKIINVIFLFVSSGRSIIYGWEKKTPWWETFKIIFITFLSIPFGLLFYVNFYLCKNKWYVYYGSLLDAGGPNIFRKRHKNLLDDSEYFCCCVVFFFDMALLLFEYGNCEQIIMESVLHGTEWKKNVRLRVVGRKRFSFRKKAKLNLNTKR